MENFIFSLFGFSILFMAAVLLFGIVELVTMPLIKPPKRRTFTQIKFAEKQYQNIVLPAAATLISGFLVSIAASFFYGDFVDQENEGGALLGIGILLVAIILFMSMLRPVFAELGDESEHARDPFSIRAAAEEFSQNPYGKGVKPDVLTEKLGEWHENLFTHSMNLSPRETSNRLNNSLEQAAQEETFWRSAFKSLNVYYAAVLCFPFRFVWPLLVFVAFMLSMLGCMYSDIVFDGFSFSWRWQRDLFVLTSSILAFSILVMYCAARGNRARRWHFVNVKAYEDAQAAIREARAVYTSAKLESRNIRSGRTILRLGSFRLSRE